MKYAGLVAGLGNPGPRYQFSRHNCGFMFIDKLLDLCSSKGEVEELPGKKFHARLWRYTLPEIRQTWLACEPQTFMNDSGKAIAPILTWHNLTPEQLLVVQDELDIPPGSLRFKFAGGLAGHNGLRSISQWLGSSDFYRLRIGIGKPENKDEMLAWVLNKPCPDDFANIRAAIAYAIQVFITFCQKGSHEAELLARQFKPDI